jgi:hypothetical protein
MRRPWIIKPWLVAAMLGAFVVHGVLAEWLGFGLLFASERQGWLQRRMMEFLLLWPFACMAVGWVQYLRKVPIARRAAVWPLVAVVGLAGLAMAADGLSDVLHAYPSWSSGRQPRMALDTAALMWTPSLWAAVILCTLSTAIIYTQALGWRQRITPGLCPVCDYDLTGNSSGACPECGERVVDDPKVPRWYFGKRFWWLPELAQFPDALARQAAWKVAMRACDRSKWQWACVVTLGLAVLATLPLPRLYAPYQYVALGVSPIGVLLYGLKLRTIQRRELRKLLGQQAPQT